MSEIQTKDLKLLYYDPLQTYLVPYVGKAYENSVQYHEKMFNWKPWQQTTVALQDLADNGGAVMGSTPFDSLGVDVAPISTTFETFTPGERFFILMNHEMAHVATLDVWNDDDGWWRNFFHGKPRPIADHPESVLYSYLAQPRAMVPRWYLEGTAVFMETWMGGGLGRAQGGYDEMVFRAMVRDDAHFFSPLGLPSEGDAVDFQVGANDYLYGTRFISYLGLTYGPEKVIAWLRRGNDSKAYYADQFEYVFGKPLSDAWDDWIKFEHDFQKKNLASVEKYPVTPFTPVTSKPLGSISRTFYDPKLDSLIVGMRDVGQLASIVSISLKDGSIRKLTNITGPALYNATSLAYDPAAEKVYFTTKNNAERDLVEADMATGETHTLFHHSRIGDIVFNQADSSIWGIRHLNGLDTLVRVRAAHDEWNQVNTFDYGTQVSELDISRDGKLLCATISKINGDSLLEVFRVSDLLDGKVQSIARLSLGQSIPEGGTFSPDGKYVYATAYYTGVSNVYRLDIETNKWDAVTNAVTGFFRPVPLADGSLIVYEYTGSGMQPVKMDPKPLQDLGAVKFLGTAVADAHPIVKTWGVGSPAKVDFDSMITDRGYYKPLDELTLDASYPYIAGYKGHIAGGWHIQFEDPLQYDHIVANVAFSPAGDLPHGQELHGDLTFQGLYWHFRYWHNLSDFYDLFGPLERARKGDALESGYHTVLIYDLPQRLDFSADLNLYSGLDTLPGAQNVHGDDHDLATAKMGLNYTDVEKSLGAVDYEAGYLANLQVITDYAHNKPYPKAHAGFDFGFALPWAHSSLWFYNAVGGTAGSKNNVLDYFYLGSFGNNYVDDREVKRYREYDSFPGFGIDEINAREFARTTAEFNFPPLRFEDVGTAVFSLNSLRSSVFAGVLEADPGQEDRKVLEDVGFQLDWNFTIAVRQPMTLSIGDAGGFAGGKPHRNEIMVSLKIL